MDDNLTSTEALHHFVPAARTRALTLAEENVGSGEILIERYAYPTSIPERTSPPIESHSLVLALEGVAEVEHRLGEGTWTNVDFRPGRSSLRPAGRPLTLRGQSQELDVLSIRFPQTLLCRIAAENKTDPSSVRVRSVPQMEDPVLTRLGQALLAHMESEGEPSTVLLASIVESIATRIFASHSAESHDIAANGALNLKTIEHIRDYIQAHLSDDITVKDLADCAGMGVSHFTHLFKETMGCPPYQYVLHQRVNAARRQLETSEMSLSQIALNVGFSSQSHLTSRFKKIVGTTPGRYRDAVQ